MQPTAPQVTTVVGISWMFIFVFLFAAFFLALIWFRRAPSAKSVAIGSVIAAFVAVPLLFIGVILFYFLSFRAPSSQRVVMSDGSVIYQNGTHFSEDVFSTQPTQIELSPPLVPAPPPVITPQPLIKRPSPNTKKKSTSKSTPAVLPSAEVTNQDAEPSAETKPADDVKPAEKPIEAESTAPTKSAIAYSTSANPRPAWVDAPPKLTGGVYRTKVTVGPFATREECDRALPAELLKATNNYVDSFLGEGASRWVNLPPGYIMESGGKHERVVNGLVIPQNSSHANGSRIYRDQWQEEILASFGPMIQVHTLLEFDENTRHDLQRRWQAGRAEGRLGYAGLGTGMVLALLGSIFGYLKIDTATRGYYTRRLQFLAALTILTTLVVGLFLIRSWNTIGFNI